MCIQGNLAHNKTEFRHQGTCEQSHSVLLSLRRESVGTAAVFRYLKGRESPGEHSPERAASGQPHSGSFSCGAVCACS